MDYSANSNSSSSEAIQLLTTFWPRITKEIQNMTTVGCFKIKLCRDLTNFFF